MLSACRAAQGMEAAFLAAVQAAMQAPGCRAAILRHPGACTKLAAALTAGLARSSLPAAWSPSLLGLLHELLCALPKVRAAAALPEGGVPGAFPGRPCS